MSAANSSDVEQRLANANLVGNGRDLVYNITSMLWAVVELKGVAM